MKGKRFIDSTKAFVIAGKGGNGCVSFRREKFVAKGGPDGGDGGRGGNVIFRANPDVDSLIGVYYQPHRRAENGGSGKGKRMNGRRGRNHFVPVPCGTEVWDIESGKLLGDLVEPGCELLVAHGGKGGLGNCHWKTSTHQTPREHSPGEPGEEFEVRLELRLVADVALVGVPNAGKSTLISVISHAHPKTGAYPFTTLNPIPGTIVFDDYSSIRIVDIPGLIKGAHEGAGLGHSFLRHIERTRFSIFVIDMAGTEGREPWKDFEILRDELALHSSELAEHPFIVAANKMDIPESIDLLAEFKTRTGIDPLPVSAVEHTGIEKLKKAINDMARTTA